MGNGQYYFYKPSAETTTKTQEPSTPEEQLDVYKNRIFDHRESYDDDFPYFS